MSEDEQAFSNPPSPLYLDSSPIDDSQPSETSTNSGSRSPSTNSDSGSEVYAQEDLSKLEYHLSPESDIPLPDQLGAMTAHLNTVLHQHSDMSRKERRELILSKVESSLSRAGIEGLEVDLHWADSDDDGSGEDEDERRGRSPRRRGSFSLVEEEEE
ncbi:hypothetical protein L198_07463 [Cryptococcus wingfieldii CBS 7118]|uniref:Uncharacterized protein n=1 Tax=Cryptococcus wingfieldii CBS 7118 TaxID=1295528 RepID=A0A1E3IBT3_9TREE|nr:hypothetical protein L198_07463 [Cryptococcus wingfieldii CBS 7118]ODN85895.1 hypothetical protein L198_07463 [Cryptococcus wingfieldii CBS 7118]